MDTCGTDHRCADTNFEESSTHSEGHSPLPNTDEVDSDVEVDSVTTVPENLDISRTDSGFQSAGHSRASSESDSWHQTSTQPSTIFPPVGIFCEVGIWSPQIADEDILMRVGSRQPLNATSNVEESWRDFSSWTRMPSPDEAEILQERELETELLINAQANAKKLAKKDLYFLRIFGKKL